MSRITLKSGDPIFPFSLEGLHYKTGKPVRIYIAGGIIAEVREISSLKHGDKENIIAPGLIDNQINGYINIDFSGYDLTSAGIVLATKAIVRDGVTSFMPTLITNDHKNLIKNFRILDRACKEDEFVNSCVPGFHLEGPYISPEEGYRGCHPAQHIRKPSWKEFSEYMKASGERIIQVTMAPEMDGAMEFIRDCVSEGIIVAIGHSKANTDQINLAVENGARLSTHLGNGCANMIHRHHNPLWPQLANDKLIPSIIADGNHLLPEELQVFIKVKGTKNIILTSDVVYLSGMAPGNYTFGELEVTLKEDGTLLVASQNVLAGASFPLKKGVENIMKFTGISLGDAVMMASENVAGIFNLNDRGKLEPGKMADIILLQMEGKKLTIKSTYKKGVSA